MKNFFRQMIVIMIMTISLIGGYDIMKKVYPDPLPRWCIAIEQSVRLEVNFLFDKLEMLTQELRRCYLSAEARKWTKKGEKESDSDELSTTNARDSLAISQGTSDSSENFSVASSDYKAVWLSYLEFSAYTRSTEKNDEAHFRTFYQSVIDRCGQLGLNRILVQVRPFGDALYPSDYFPWAACISDKQGKSPGYDPLKIMVEISHKAGIAIEAWINPYRISSGGNINALSDDNMAKKWYKKKKTRQRVLQFEDSLYYNPSSAEVRTLICDGVKELVDHYDIDGIHMDDYFYPTFTKENVATAFDAPQYREYKKTIRGKLSSMSIADWRRNNINQLVENLHCVIRSEKSNVRFGISPMGNLSNLRSDLEYYVDIDTWIKKGYVDYIMPQIYWGFTNDTAPFEQTVQDWLELLEASASDIKLYVGLPLYKVGISEKNLSDYKEWQDADTISDQIAFLKNAGTDGYALFSYQYLDFDNPLCSFDASQFSKKRKNLLKKFQKSFNAG